jgi:hypothetical protein
VQFTTQTNTVHVNEAHRGLVENNTVLLFDDFTSSGMSLEWGRNLLYAAGAARVVLVTVGKYGQPFTSVYEPYGADISPYIVKDYDEDSFTRRSYKMEHDTAAYERLKKSFNRYAESRVLLPTS